MARKPWTVQEIETLRRLYPDCKTATLALLFGKKLSVVASKANYLGLHKSEGFMKSPLSGRISKANDIGAGTRFNDKTGGWNKGMKQVDYMSTENIEKTKSTQFKKGQNPHNTVELGHERINIEGYIEVKTNHFKDGNAKNKNFEYKHRLLWQEHHGPIPEGMVIAINGDKLNFTIDNLEMITKAENVIRNGQSDTAIIKKYFKIKDPEMIEKVISEVPDVIQLKRTNLILNTQIKNYENNN